MTERVPGVQPLNPAGCVDACQKPLGRSLLVTGGAVDLAGEEQALYEARFQTVVQTSRIKEVVFDRVAGTGDVCVLETLDALDERDLHIERQAGRNAVRVKLHGIEAFGFDEHLVRVLVGKPHDLVFDRGAVARPYALYHARIHRRTVERGADDLVGALVGVGDVAGNLPGMLRDISHEAHDRQGCITVLYIEPLEVHRAGIDARRRTCFEAPYRKRHFTQA